MTTKPSSCKLSNDQRHATSERISRHILIYEGTNASGMTVCPSQNAKCRKSNTGCLATHTYMYMYVSSYAYMTYCKMCVCICLYVCMYVGTKTSNVDHMPTIFVKVCTATKKKRTCLIYVHTDMYINICCDVYYHVSGNENVEQ